MADSQHPGRPTFRKPAPDGVVELVGATEGPLNGLVERSDGTLMAFDHAKHYRSSDKGLSWDGGRPIECAGMKGCASCIQLNYGKLDKD